MSPVAGLVRFAVPEMERVPDAFFPECVADIAVVVEEDIFFADHEDDLHFFEQGDDLGILEVGDEEPGHIKIYRFVAIAIKEVVEVFHGGSEVITAAKAHHFVKQVGMFKGQVSGVVSAEATAGGDYSRMGIELPDKLSDDFQEDVFFVLEVTLNAFGGVDIAGVEAFFVDAVEAVDLDGPGFDLFPEGVDDLPILVVIEVGSAGGEKEDRFAGVSEDQQFHFPAQVWAEPSMIFSSHGFLPDRYCRMISFHKA